MSDIRFYVVDDLISGHSGAVEYFDDVKGALGRYLALENNAERMPALGVQVGNGGLDLIQGICGENVLVPDYRRPGILCAPDMQDALDDIYEIVKMFVLEGVVRQEFLTVPLVDSVRTLVPVTMQREDYEEGYCKGKTLKTSHRDGLDALDSLFITGHGWVVFSDLQANPEQYCKDGYLSVDAMNVVYIRDKNVVGIDGRMDVCPSDFAKMVERVNKPYVLVAYDAFDYNFQYKGKHDFIVASYESLPEAVMAWYDFSDRNPGVPMYVGQKERGREVSVFNGKNADFESISREDAGRIYGFDADGKTVETLIADASERSICAPRGDAEVREQGTEVREFID